MLLRATPDLRRRPAALTRQDSPDGPPFSVRTCASGDTSDDGDDDDARDDDGSDHRNPDTPTPAPPEPLILRLPEAARGQRVFRRERSSRRTAEHEQGEIADRK